MKRAKFETPAKQREFFIKVKEKLGIGAKELSKRLGLKSRGNIESYTLMRTSPPVNIIKNLEQISGIKAKYTEIEGKIYRKRKKFMPFDPKEAEKNLREKFGKDFEYLTKLIKSKLSIKEILIKIRKKGHSFDTGEVGRWIGAFRTNLLVKIVQDLTPRSNEIVLNGYIRKDRKTLSINFHLSYLSKILSQRDIRVGLEITKDRKKIRLFPLNFGRKLIKSNRVIKILLTEKSGIKEGDKKEIILNPAEFGFSIIESIYDQDAKVLAKEAIKKGFKLDSQRSTPNNHKGDLSLFHGEKNILIEITRAKTYKSSYFKIGQCFMQKTCWPNSKQFIVCGANFLSKDSKKALNKLGIKIINTSFQQNWQKRVLEQLQNEI